MTSGFGADVPDGLVGEVLVVTALCDPAGKQPGLRLPPPLVLAECVEQLRGQRHIAILAALALADVNDHALAIDVFHAKPYQFTASYASRVQQHEDGPRLEIAGGVNEPGHFVRAQYLRHAGMGVLRVRYGIGRKPPLQRAHKEESQRGHLSDHGIRLQVPLAQQVGLVLTNMLRTEWLAEESREPLDSADIGAGSCWREVTSLEFLQHHFAKTGHKDTSL